MTANRSQARYAAYPPPAVNRAEGERRSRFVFEKESIQRTTGSKSSLWETPNCFTTAVTGICMLPDGNNLIKMEVGIEDCLHIEFEYNKSRYHLKDVIVGKIYFLLVRIKTKHMELSIIRRETTGSPASQHNESETITIFDIMDGAPVRAVLPTKAKQSQFDYPSAEFSTRYYLNLVLIDEESQRYLN
ncbi:vacuolar protein sorting-associated protein 26-domain-containing protein [Lactarius hatsudake]|nr:vacuolar protein sorting-associated protein 26-domain-containing protein [Lactarius hatsudake]